MIEGQPDQEAAEHVRQCAQCASEIEAARRSIRRLETMEWPVMAPRRATHSAPLLKWALAACLALCAGFAFGRLSAPNAAEIQAAVKAQVTQEIRHDLIAYINEQARTRSTAPPENPRAILSVLAELRDQQTANYLSLRSDLETLASNADARLRSTSRLLEIATSSVPPSSDLTH